MFFIQVALIIWLLVSLVSRFYKKMTQEAFLMKIAVRYGTQIMEVKYLKAKVTLPDGMYWVTCQGDLFIETPLTIEEFVEDFAKA